MWLRWMLFSLSRNRHAICGFCIDNRRNSKGYDEFYSYIKNMSDREYRVYLDAIKSFIKSEKIYPFSEECFADTIINEIISGRKNE